MNPPSLPSAPAAFLRSTDPSPNLRNQNIAPRRTQTPFLRLAVLVICLQFGALASNVGVLAAQQIKLLEIPDVNLDLVERAVRDQLLAERAKVAQNTRRPPLELATLYGHLGELYVIYDLVAPAEAALRNAIALDPDSPRWPYILGTILQLDRRMDESTRQFEASIAAQENGPALMRLAKIQLEQGDLAEARTTYQRARSLAGYEAGAAAGLGRVALEEERPLEAIPLFEEALAAQPRATALNYQLGLAFRAVGESERAREVLARRGDGEFRFPDPIAMELQQSATGVGAMLSLGRLSLAEGLDSVAEERFRKAVEIDPMSAAAHRSLGGVLQQQGKIDEALVSLERAIQLEPDRAGVRYSVAQLLMNNPDAEGQRLDRAIGHLEAAIAQAPDFVPGLLDLANARRRVGRNADALEALDRALQLRPGSAGIRFQRAQLLLASGRSTEALDELKRVAESDDPTVRSSRARSDIAQMFTTLGQATQATQIYRGMAEDATLSTSERALAASLLGQMHAESGEVPEAISAFEAGLALEPSLPDLQYNLGTVLGRAGRYPESAAAMLEALKSQPQRHEARFAAGMALLLSDRSGEAKQLLEEGLDLDPGHAPMAHLLTRILVASPDEAARDGVAGLALARKLFEAQPSLDHAETVAMALAELGQFDRAVEWQQRIVTQIEGAGDEAPREMLERAQRHLGAYEEASPIRSPWIEP